MFLCGQSISREVVMKRDTQHRPGVSKTAHAAPVGDPRTTSPQKQQASGVSVNPISVTVSARYIDSRLKQFWCR